MDFELTPEQRMFADSARDFSQRALAEGRHERAMNDGFPWHVARRMADAGLFGIAMAERDRGQGGTLMDAVLAIEQVSLVCPRSADVVQAGNFGAIRTVAEYATPDQKRRYLRPLLAAVRRALASPADAEAMVDAVRGFAVLRGYRGRARGDCNALAHAICAVSDLARVPDTGIREAEINPLVVRADGDGVVAVDGLVVRAGDGV